LDIAISSDGIKCVVSTAGGAIWRLDARSGDGTGVPLLRPPPTSDDRDVLKSGCFPLVPFGNRVAGNRFSFGGKEYRLAPNTPWDAHYLHGDGWLREWKVHRHDTGRLELGLEHEGEVYSYAAHQTFVARERHLTVSLSVETRGVETLPFGLGWHPFFPLTPQTTLAARAKSYWIERAGWLPDEEGRIPAELDFSAPRRPPRHWVNNGFESWDGNAGIVWPERGVMLSISTNPPLTRYFVFVSDKAFDPTYNEDFFCFEPMSHSANGQNLPDFGGLAALKPRDSLSISMRLAWSAIDEANRP
jgi:aldose 1-epimerase